MSQKLASQPTRKAVAQSAKSKLRTTAEIVWLYYSAVSGLFLIGLMVDLLYIWTEAYSNGAVLYVNHFGEGNIEMFKFISVLPWLAVTLGRTFTRIEPKRGCSASRFTMSRRLGSCLLSSRSARRPLRLCSGLSPERPVLMVSGTSRGFRGTLRLPLSAGTCGTRPGPFPCRGG